MNEKTGIEIDKIEREIELQKNRLDNIKDLLAAER